MSSKSPKKRTKHVNNNTKRLTIQSTSQRIPTILQTDISYNYKREREVMRTDNHPLQEYLSGSFIKKSSVGRKTWKRLQNKQEPKRINSFNRLWWYIYESIANLILNIVATDPGQGPKWILENNKKKAVQCKSDLFSGEIPEWKI